MLPGGGVSRGILIGRYFSLVESTVPKVRKLVKT